MSETKELAQKVVPVIEKDLELTVCKTVSASGLSSVTGRNGKHLAKVLGFQLMVAARDQGIPLNVAAAGLIRGAQLALERLSKNENASFGDEGDDE